MTDDKALGSQRLKWLLAGMLALSTVFVGFVAIGSLSQTSSPADNPQVVAETQPSPPAPSAGEAAAVDASAGTGLSLDDPVQSMLNDCGSGNLNACTSVLETLAQECYEGHGTSCDALYLVSPIASEYERYGGTCGGYFTDETHAGRCSEL